MSFLYLRLHFHMSFLYLRLHFMLYMCGAVVPLQICMAFALGHPAPTPWQWRQTMVAIHPCPHCCGWVRV